MPPALSFTDDNFVHFIQAKPLRARSDKSPKPRTSGPERDNDILLEILVHDDRLGTPAVADLQRQRKCHFVLDTSCGPHAVVSPQILARDHDLQAPHDDTGRRAIWDIERQLLYLRDTALASEGIGTGSATPVYAADLFLMGTGNFDGVASFLMKAEILVPNHRQRTLIGQEPLVAANIRFSIDYSCEPPVLDVWVMKHTLVPPLAPSTSPA